jgi:predicted AAA+ superfamily ATPase
MDGSGELSLAETEPASYLSNRKIPFAIDECQLCPPLFPALKEQVRLKKKMGQYILTGSVRFTSRAAIRESLTGRIVNIELLPMSLSEAAGEPLNDLLEKLVQNKRLPEIKAPNKNDFNEDFAHFLENGGLPGICFYRDPAVRKNRFAAHLETLIERDLRLILTTTLPNSTIRTLTEELAQVQGEPLEWSLLARNTGIATNTLKKLLAALEGLFLIRQIQGPGRTPVIFFEDQGVASYLLKRRGVISSSRNQPGVPDILRGLYACLATQNRYLPSLGGDFFQYRTRGGAQVPLALRSEGGSQIGFVCSREDQATPSNIRSAQSFCAQSEKSYCLIVHLGSRTRQLSPRVWEIPLRFIV